MKKKQFSWSNYDGFKKTVPIFDILFYLMCSLVLQPNVVFYTVVQIKCNDWFKLYYETHKKLL